MTRVLDELLASVRDDAPVRAVRRGDRATAVWSRGVGLASACEGPPAEAAPLPQADSLEGRSAREVAELARSAVPRQAALGLAALNSLLDPEGLRLEEASGQQLLSRLAPGRRVCLVGRFPFTPALRGWARQLVVLELLPAEGELPAAAAALEIPAADLVVITGCTLVNHTLDALLELARGKLVLLIGPSTPLHPLLLERGVSALCGSVTVDAEAALAAVQEGLSFRRCPGLRRVILKRDPL